MTDLRDPSAAKTLLCSGRFLRTVHPLPWSQNLARDSVPQSIQPHFSNNTHQQYLSWLFHIRTNEILYRVAMSSPRGSEAYSCAGLCVGCWRGAQLYTTLHPSEPLSCVSFREPLINTRAAQTTCDNSRTAPTAAVMATQRSTVKRNEYTFSTFQFKMDEKLDEN